MLGGDVDVGGGGGWVCFDGGKVEICVVRHSLVFTWEESCDSFAGRVNFVLVLFLFVAWPGQPEQDGVLSSQSEENHTLWIECLPERVDWLLRLHRRPHPNPATPQPYFRGLHAETATSIVSPSFSSSVLPLSFFLLSSLRAGSDKSTRIVSPISSPNC